MKKRFVRTVQNRNGKRESFLEPADKPPQITHVYLKTCMLIVIIICIIIIYIYIIYERYYNKYLCIVHEASRSVIGDKSDV